MDAQPYPETATHWCPNCDAPVYDDGEHIVDAREGETYDLCRETPDGHGPHHLGQRTDPAGTPVLTFRQYVDAARRAAATRYELPLAEIARELPEHRYVQEWRDYVVRAFNDGATIPTRLWRTFDEGLRYRVLRSTRALRDNDLTRELVGKTAHSR